MEVRGGWKNTRFEERSPEQQRLVVSFPFWQTGSAFVAVTGLNRKYKNKIQTNLVAFERENER